MWHCVLLGEGDFNLTLSAVLVFSDGLKQTLTELRNQAFVGPVAHHGVTLPWASLPVGQQSGIVTLQTTFQDRTGLH